MINDQPQEISGESLSYWDQFYAEHYHWLYESSLKLKKSEDQARDLTQRVFTKLLLSRPEMVMRGSRESISMEIGLIYPALKDFLKNRVVSVNDLLQDFYSPN